MELKLGMIVKSKAGHDFGRFYVVVKILNGRAFIADGKLRKIEKPKAKNPAHLSRSTKVVDLSNFKTDKSLRKLLHDYNYKS